MEQAPPLNFNLKVQGRSQPQNADQPTSSAANSSDAAPVNAQPQQQKKKKNAAKTAAASRKPAVGTKAQPRKGNVQENTEKHKKEKEEKAATVRQKKIGNIQHKSIPTDNPKRISAGKIGPNWINIDKESKYNANDVLGYGCYGTVVYRGEFDGRKVAVKRVLLNLPHVEREKELLIASDDNQNILRYLRTKSTMLFRYLILELCEASLADYVENKVTRDSLNITTKEILRQCTKGLAHLHNCNIKIVHRDLKPQNVLFFKSASGEIIMKLSDFGAGKKIEDGRLSFSVTNGLVGTSGWIAPEVLNNGTTVTDKIDIFSLGCIFYYVLTGGSHPYGLPLYRNSNIIKGDFSLADLVSDDARLSSHLISLAIAFSPTLRPSAKAILSHPFFWDTKTQLDFFSEVSNKLTRESSGTSIIMKRLDKDQFKIIKSDWTKQICHGVKQDLMKIRQYDGTSVRDLLRVIRNYKSHYEERPPAVQKLLGEYPHGLAVYFTSRFPDLLLHVHDAIELYCEQSVFAPFYSDDARIQVKKDREKAEKKVTGQKTKKSEKKLVAPTSPMATKENMATATSAESPQELTSHAIPETLIRITSSRVTVVEKYDSKELSSETSALTSSPDSVVTTKPTPILEPPPVNTIVHIVSPSPPTTSEKCENNLPQLELKDIHDLPPAPSVVSTLTPDEEHDNIALESTMDPSTPLISSSLPATTDNGETNPLQSEIEMWTMIDGAITVEELIKQVGLRSIEEEKSKVSATENWVGKLKEFCEQNKMEQPKYKTDPLTEGGFTTLATTGIFKESGSGKKKQEAKLEAARKLFNAIRGNSLSKQKPFCEQNSLPDPENELEEKKEPQESTSNVADDTSTSDELEKMEQQEIADTARNHYHIIDFSPLLSYPTHGLWVGKLAEYCLKNKLPPPGYAEPTEETGADKMKTFITSGTVGTIEEIGRGKNKKESKADAARKLAELVVVSLRKTSEGSCVKNEEKEEEIEDISDDHLAEAAITVKGGAQEERKEESIEGILAEPVVDVSRAHTEEAPREAIKTILADKSRFLSHSIIYRDVEEPSTRGRTQAFLTVEFKIAAEGEEEYTRVFSGEGMDSESAREEAARAALVHFLTYE